MQKFVCMDTTFSTNSQERFWGWTYNILFFFVNIPSISMHDSERRHAFHRNYIENHELSPNIKVKHLILENSKNSIRTFLSRKSNVRKLPILTCRPKNRVRTTWDSIWTLTNSFSKQSLRNMGRNFQCIWTKKM